MFFTVAVLTVPPSRSFTSATVIMPTAFSDVWPFAVQRNTVEVKTFWAIVWMSVAIAALVEFCTVFNIWINSIIFVCAVKPSGG